MRSARPRPCPGNVFFFLPGTFFSSSLFFSQRRNRPRQNANKKKNFQKTRKHRDTAQLYAQLAEAGLQYGPAFRLLRNVHVPEEAMKASE